MIACSLCVASPAQDSTQQYFRVLKASPLNLFFFYQSFQLAYEHQLTRKISAQAEAGVVLSRPGYVHDNQYLSMRGTKLKAELRYYLAGLRVNRPNFYTSLEPYYNIINFDRDLTQRECFDLNCNSQIQHRYYFVVKYREPGVAWKMGLQISKRNFIVDFSAGVRARFIDYEKPSIPEGIDNNNNIEPLISILPNEEKRVTAGFITDIKLGYRFGRKTKPSQSPTKKYIEYF